MSCGRAGSRAGGTGSRPGGTVRGGTGQHSAWAARRGAQQAAAQQGAAGRCRLASYWPRPCSACSSAPPLRNVQLGRSRRAASSLAALQALGASQGAGRSRQARRWRVNRINRHRRRHPRRAARQSKAGRPLRPLASEHPPRCRSRGSCGRGRAACMHARVWGGTVGGGRCWGCCTGAALAPLHGERSQRLQAHMQLGNAAATAMSASPQPQPTSAT